MADGVVATQPAAAPTAPKVPGTLAQQPGAGWGPDEINALNKLNWQSENFLAGDKETLTNMGANYNRALQGLGETESTGFKTLRSRNFASGLENSGFALGNREELAGRYTNRRAGMAEKVQQGYNKIGAGIQKEEGAVKLGAGNIANAYEKRKSDEKRKAELEAKPPPAAGGTTGGNAATSAAFFGPGSQNPAALAAAATPGMGGVQGYPKATAYINTAFPGGQKEHEEYVKAPGAVKAQWYLKRAKGGPVKAGGAYIVGERGPELMVPKVPGRVVPNNRLAAIRKALRGRR